MFQCPLHDAAQQANVCVVELRVSATAALVGYPKCDQIRSHFAQQMLRQCTGAALREALEFEQVLRYAAHFNLLRRMPSNRIGCKSNRFPVTKVSVRQTPKQISRR
jgi:hypothetical protein